jgi:hypothetical protein
MPSSGPPSDIPLDTLPFLNNNRHTHNGVIFTDQPAIGHHTPAGDHDEEAGEDDEEEANGDADAETGPLHHQRHRHRHRHQRRRTRTRSPLTATIEPAWRRQLYNLLERPNSSAAAVLVHVLVTALIVFSALVTILETVPVFHSLPGGIWFGLETSLVALFTVEYVARCAATSYSWSALFAWVGCACAFLCAFFFFLSLPSLSEAVNVSPDYHALLSPIPSVLWHHGPSGHPSLLHRDRSAKGYGQCFLSQPHGYLI